MAKQSQLDRMIADVDAQMDELRRRREWLADARDEAKPKKREKAAKGKRAPLTLDSLGS